MAKLHLMSLVCHNTEDDSGPDDARLVVQGVTRWKRRMNDGEAVNLEETVAPIEFEKRVRIDLFDDDQLDPDDHLGTTYAFAEQAGKGEFEHTFLYDWLFSYAKYVLIWKVVE